MNLRFLCPLFALMLLFSCKQKPVPEPGDRPVKLVEVEPLDELRKSYSGFVAPDQFSDLAFKMSGPLVSLNVLEGQRVKAGQVVAEIDHRDFTWEYEARKSSFLTAQSQLQRIEKLLSKNAVSQQDYESSKAAFSNAKSAFEYAQNTLEQTKLRAPFDGFIQKKYVENYQKVQAGQAIVCLVNPSKLQIEFTIPETNVEYFTSPHSLFVEFDSYKGKMFKAKIKEYVEASPDGSGVPVFLYIDDSEFDLNKYKISVGFSCRVVLKVIHESFKQAVRIPLSAIVLDERSKEKSVYVYNQSSRQVERRKILENGFLMGKDEVIVTGLKAGEKIVSAGASYLVDKQTVKVLTD